MMLANILKREIMQRKTIYDGVSELSVVSDIVLPEDLGDIERILKCTFTPRLSSKSIEGTRLSLQGGGALRMVYKTADGIESFETQVPFSKNIDMPQSAGNAKICADLCLEFCSCRAISARRFEMNVGIKVKAKVCALEPLELTVGSQEENVEFKKMQTEAIIPVSCTCENFTVMEEYELSGEPVKSVVKATATPSVLEHKIISGKVVLKGSVDFCAVYTTEGSDSPTRVNYTIPVNHIISASSAEEDDSAEVTLSVCRLSVETSERGGRGELIVEIFLEACADIVRRETVFAAIDAYCVGLESKCTHQNIALTTLEKREEKSYGVNVSDLTDGGEMIDTFAEVKNVSARVNEQGEIMMSAEALVSALCRDENGEIYIKDKNVPIEFSLAADPEYASSQLSPSLRLDSVTASKNTAALSLSALCEISKKQSLPMVSEVEIMPDCPRRANPKTAMTIYFAKKGEDAFDIAKRYSTSAQAVLTQNSLDDTTIDEDMTILIPMIR